MKKYKLKIDWESDEIEAENEEQAYEKFWDVYAFDIQQDLEVFITDRLNIIKLNGRKK